MLYIHCNTLDQRFYLFQADNPTWTDCQAWDHKRFVNYSCACLMLYTYCNKVLIIIPAPPRFKGC